MKNFFLLSAILFSVNIKAQKASLTDDVATYLGKSYKTGDIIHLAYGSGNNKEFAFVNYGKSVGGINLPGLYHHANTNWSKAELEILKVYKTSGVLWLKCKPMNMESSIGSVLGNKIFINLEGAVDNKEINSASMQIATAAAPLPQKKNDNVPVRHKKITQ